MNRSFPALDRFARIRIVSVNDVYELTNLPRLETFWKALSPKPSAVVLAGDFLSPSTLSSIDGGRGMVATLKAIGTTHVSLGNHEQDLRLDSLKERLEELTAPSSETTGVVVLNTNLQTNLPSKAQWMTSVTKPYSLIQSPCGRVQVGLLGLLSDEPGLFRDNTFKSVPIQNILEAYEEVYKQLGLLKRPPDLLIPLTHASLHRDKELARYMLSLHQASGVIVGGHEHDPYHEIVTRNESTENVQDAVHILKSGMDARNACLIDLKFQLPMTHKMPVGKPVLVDIESELIDLSEYEPSPTSQQVVDKHMSVVQALEDEIIIDANSMLSTFAPNRLSSERSRFQQTTIGSVFCQMIKEELEDCQVAMLNGAVLKGDRLYETSTMSYAELKDELPFPTKMVVVEMTRAEVYTAIEYSRKAIEPGNRSNQDEIPRRGYLQVDHDFERVLAKPTEDSKKNDSVAVALPRNLLNGFCKIKPLMEVGTRLKEEGRFPGDDDFVPAIDLIVRHACKNRWLHLVKDEKDFERFDINNDGILDKDEIKLMMKETLGYKPADFVVADMLSALDADENGVIDQQEFRRLLEQLVNENER